jgi:hypothetical protein
MLRRSRGAVRAIDNAERGRGKRRQAISRLPPSRWELGQNRTPGCGSLCR